MLQSYQQFQMYTTFNSTL